MWRKSTELLVPSQTAQKWKKPLSSHLDIEEQASEQNTYSIQFTTEGECFVFPGIFETIWILKFVWWLWDVKAACSRKEIRFLALLEVNAFKSVTLVKANTQMLQNPMSQNTAKKFGGARMERTGRLIANKRAFQVQFLKGDVLSTAMTGKITSLFSCPFPVSNSYKCHQQYQQETSTEGRMWRNKMLACFRNH